MPVANPSIPTQEAWKAPVLVNGWLNYGAPFNSVGYWKDSLGVVHLRGLVKSGTAGSVIFTLPTGYRPAAREMFASIGSNGMTQILGRFDVDSDGSVTHNSGGTNYFTIDGCTFRAN